MVCVAERLRSRQVGRRVHIIEMACLHCGKVFTTEYKSRKGRKFCTISCGVKFRSPRVSVNCAQCGIIFDRQPSEVGRSKSKLHFCSMACKAKAQRIGGIREIQPAHYGTTKSDYRSVALRNYGARCASCGYNRDLRILDIDHIDNTRSNNSLSNLQGLCIWCHALKTRGVESHEWNGELAQ